MYNFRCLKDEVAHFKYIEAISNNFWKLFSHLNTSNFWEAEHIFFQYWIESFHYIPILVYSIYIGNNLKLLSQCASAIEQKLFQFYKKSFAEKTAKCLRVGKFLVCIASKFSILGKIENGCIFYRTNVCIISFRFFSRKI